MTKESYKNAQQKHAVREFLVSHFPFESIVGLPGPDINHYLKWCDLHGFKQIEAWEKEPIIAISQMFQVKKLDFSYNMGDIIHADANMNNTLYDLDYCCTIVDMEEHIKKFRKNFIMTFSRRIKGGMNINKFIKIAGEKATSIINKTRPINHVLCSTNKGSRYIYLEYQDTSPMCCIAKIK